MLHPAIPKPSAASPAAKTVCVMRNVKRTANQAGYASVAPQSVSSATYAARGPFGWPPLLASGCVREVQQRLRERLTISHRLVRHAPNAGAVE